MRTRTIVGIATIAVASFFGGKAYNTSKQINSVKENFSSAEADSISNVIDNRAGGWTGNVFNSNKKLTLWTDAARDKSAKKAKRDAKAEFAPKMAQLEKDVADLKASSDSLKTVNSGLKDRLRIIIDKFTETTKIGKIKSPGIKPGIKKKTQSNVKTGLKNARKYVKNHAKKAKRTPIHK